MSREEEWRRRREGTGGWLIYSCSLAFAQLLFSVAVKPRKRFFKIGLTALSVLCILLDAIAFGIFFRMPGGISLLPR